MWREIVDALGDRAVRPFAILDRKGRTQYLNPRLEELLQCQWRKVLGSSWAREFSAKGHQTDTERQVSLAVRGEIQTADVMVQSAGIPVRLRVEFDRVGTGAAQQLLAVVLRAKPDALALARATDSELDYEIATSASSFGALRHVAVGCQKIPLVGETRCFTLFHDRAAPCSDCPVLTAGTEAWPRIAVRLTESGPRGASAQLIMATPNGSDLVKMCRRTLSSEAMAAVHSTKMQALIARAGLSEREALVFRQMLEAHSLTEIAGRIHISVRTVKHHQTSLLRKLGARSKADLIRIVACDRLGPLSTRS